MPSQTHDCQAPRSQDSHSSLGTDSLRERERDLQKPCVPIPAAYLGGSGGGGGGQDGGGQVSSGRRAFVAASADAHPPPKYEYGRPNTSRPNTKDEYGRPSTSRPNTAQEGGGRRGRIAPHERPKTAAVQARSFIKTSIGAFVRIAEGRAEPEISPFHKLVSHQFVTPHPPVPPATAAEPEKRVTSSQFSRLQTSRPPLHSQLRDALFTTGPRQQHQVQVARLRVGQVGKLLHVAPGSDTTAIQELAAAPLTALATMSVSDNKVLNQYGAVQVMLQAPFSKVLSTVTLYSKHTRALTLKEFLPVRDQPGVSSTGASRCAGMFVAAGEVRRQCSFAICRDQRAGDRLRMPRQSSPYRAQARASSYRTPPAPEPQRLPRQPGPLQR